MHRQRKACRKSCLSREQQSLPSSHGDPCSRRQNESVCLHEESKLHLQDVQCACSEQVCMCLLGCTLAKRPFCMFLSHVVPLLIYFHVFHSFSYSIHPHSLTLTIITVRTPSRTISTTSVRRRKCAYDTWTLIKQWSRRRIVDRTFVQAA